jgi:hypothetical protein
MVSRDVRGRINNSTASFFVYNNYSAPTIAVRRWVLKYVVQNLSRQSREVTCIRVYCRPLCSRRHTCKLVELVHRSWMLRVVQVVE